MQEFQKQSQEQSIIQNPVVVLGNHDPRIMQERAKVAFEYAGCDATYFCSGFRSEALPPWCTSEAMFLRHQLIARGALEKNIMTDHFSQNTIGTILALHNEGITGEIPFVSYPGHLNRVELIVDAYNREYKSHCEFESDETMRVVRVETTQGASQFMYEMAAKVYLRLQLRQSLEDAARNSPPLKTVAHTLQRMLHPHKL